MITGLSANILKFTLQIPDFQNVPHELLNNMVCRIQIKRKTPLSQHFYGAIVAEYQCMLFLSAPHEPAYPISAYTDKCHHHIAAWLLQRAINGTSAINIARLQRIELMNIQLYCQIDCATFALPHCHIPVTATAAHCDQNWFKYTDNHLQSHGQRRANVAVWTRASISSDCGNGLEVKCTRTST
jgi:hypothetical protein